MTKTIYNIDIIPFFGDDSERYRTHYGWLHIVYSSKIAESIDESSSHFKRAILWYSNFRHIWGNHNSFLDAIIDSDFSIGKITREEYNSHQREYFLMGAMGHFKW